MKRIYADADIFTSLEEYENIKTELESHSLSSMQHQTEMKSDIASIILKAYHE